ncbi:MAG: hypothetical protein A2539_03810 [Elusimicrobia bacterium RIFOXYD2_FULL_34_15]|nr:MAG: hypothetical protein A2539_03810 [Elusimicrobia bacterium RIFOXYD2_FULL_34_15]
MKKILCFLLSTFLPFYLATCLLYSEIDKIAEKRADSSYSIQSKSKKEKIKFYVSEGNEHLIRGEYSDAIDFYNKARELKKKNSNVLFLLGEAYRLADMKEEAINSYEKALEFGSKDIRIYLGLGNIFKLKYLYNESEEFYDRALKDEENNITALRGLAEAYETEGRYQKSLLLYEKIYSVDSSHEMKFKIAFLNVLIGNYDKAEKYIGSLPGSKILNGYINIKKNPNLALKEFTSTNEHLLKALVYLEMKNTVDAKKDLEILINQDENTLSKRLATILYKDLN